MRRFPITVKEGYTTPFSSRPLNRLDHFFTANRKTTHSDCDKDT